MCTQPLCLVCFFLIAPASDQSTDVISKADRSRRVPMKQIAVNWSSGSTLKTPEFTMRRSGSDYVVTGVDRNGRNWRASLGPNLNDLWKAGSAYFFTGPTLATGIGPELMIAALTFGQANRPSPLYLQSYSGTDQDGIEDLLDLDGSGLELLQQDWCDTNWDHSTVPAQSGYWITSLLKQRDGFWHRSDGRHGAMEFPVYQKWSRWLDRPPEATARRPVPEAWIPDHGNDPATGFKTRIVNLTQYGIRVEPTAGCEEISVDVAVHDTASDREIAFDGSNQLRQLLRSIINTGAPVLLSGATHRHDSRTCRFSVLWADSSRR